MIGSMAPAGGGVKGFYRQAKKRGGVAKSSASGKRSKNKPPQQCATQDEGRGPDQMEQEEELRRFDMDMKDGPCIGFTRFQRWERAAAMGLSPPPHLRELLLRLGAPADSSLSWSPAPKNSASLAPPSLLLQCI